MNFASFVTAMLEEMSHAAMGCQADVHFTDYTSLWPAWSGEIVIRPGRLEAGKFVHEQPGSMNEVIVKPSSLQSQTMLFGEQICLFNAFHK